jgi:hypothetical protein
MVQAGILYLKNFGFLSLVVVVGFSVHNLAGGCVLGCVFGLGCGLGFVWLWLWLWELFFMLVVAGCGSVAGGRRPLSEL